LLDPVRSVTSFPTNKFVYATNKNENQCCVQNYKERIYEMCTFSGGVQCPILIRNRNGKVKYINLKGIVMSRILCIFNFIMINIPTCHSKCLNIATLLHCLMVSLVSCPVLWLTGYEYVVYNELFMREFIWFELIQRYI
jgi:hypothetical protein